MHIYFDFNASTPVAPEVAARMETVLHEPFGNPSSDHWAGTSARDAVETARAEVAALLGCAVELSAILQAMHVPPQSGMGAIRFSWGRTTTHEKIETVVQRLKVVLT